MNKKLSILIGLAVLMVGTVLFLKSGTGGTNLIWSISNGGKILFPLVIVSSLIDSINPCAFSILILTIAFLFGIGRMRGKIIQIGLVYVLGIFIVYVLIGLGIMQTMHLFNTPHFMAKIGASLLIILGGINLINEFFPAFPIKLKIPDAAHFKMATLMEKGSIPTAFLLGALVGICEFPCTGGPYLMILGLLHDHATYINGLLYLLVYNLIFILPLLVILFIATDEKLIDKVKSWQQKERKLMRFGGGIAMIILGVIIFLL